MKLCTTSSKIQDIVLDVLHFCRYGCLVAGLSELLFFSSQMVAFFYLCYRALTWLFDCLMMQVPRIDKRVHALAKLGYKTCVVPKQAVKALGTDGLENIKIVGCKNLKEFINVVFSR